MADMAPVDLPYLQVYRVEGKLFAYYRRAGRRIRLPEPGSPSFATAYEAARLAVEHALAAPKTKPAPRALPGTLAALWAAYQASGSFQQLAPATQADYRRLMASPLARFGTAIVADAPRSWVLARQSELIATPRSANYLAAVIRRLFSFGVETGAMPGNPATRIKPLRTGPGHRIWTDAEVAALTGQAAGDVALPVLLALHTAQRQADVLRLLWSAYDGRAVRLIQGKTRTPVVIPAHPDLTAALDALPRLAAVICTTTQGRPWTSGWFKHRFAAVRAKLGLPDDLHFHGLRHSAASRLAEAGASDAEIKAITGHKTAAMVTRYTAGARQEQLAAAGMARLSRKRS